MTSTKRIAAETADGGTTLVMRDRITTELRGGEKDHGFVRGLRA